jgi:hypothetical protein
MRKEGAIPKVLVGKINITCAISELRKTGVMTIQNFWNSPTI